MKSLTRRQKRQTILTVAAVFFCSYFFIASVLRTFGWTALASALAWTYLVVYFWELTVRRTQRRETQS